MGYTITSYSRGRARALGVTIKQSKNAKKKIDVFKKVKNSKGEIVLKKVASIGAIGYGDYPTFKKTRGIEYANKRRKAYKSRMSKNRNKVGTPGYYADKILW
tara:strand:+ start:7862 stop:8167 length:306 start_codon:yes stop_codon:yes gene_type:complete